MANVEAGADILKATFFFEPPVTWMVSRGQVLNDSTSGLQLTLTKDGKDGALAFSDMGKDEALVVNLTTPESPGELDVTVVNSYGRKESGIVRVNLYMCDTKGEPILQKKK